MIFRRTLKTEGVQRILVRAVNWIGDAVMTTPAMGALRAAFPAAEIVVAAQPPVADLFRFHPYCDRVIVFDRKGIHGGIRGLVRFAAELRREKFDLAVLLQNAIQAAIIAAAAGIPQRLGYRTDGRGMLLTHGIAMGEEEERLHHTAYYVRMLQRAGIQGGDGQLRLACTAEEIAHARELLGEGEWIAINPGAAYGSAKRWFPDRFAEVADRLSDEFGTRVLITGGSGEVEIGEDIASAMRTPPLNLVGRTKVREMMALLSLCRLVVTNDSGPMHVAAAFGVPIVAIFGPTDHTTTSPFSEKFRLVRRDADCAPCLLRHCPTDHRCMERITATDVITAARELLGEGA